MKKSIFLFFAAILCSVSAWAYDLAAGQYVYFEKPADWSNVSLLLGHNSWSQGYNMTKITNTNLYYWKTESWGGYTRYCFIDATGWGGEGKKPDDRKGYASHSTNVFTNQLIKYHLFTSSGSKSSDASDRTKAINRTQTIKVQLKDGSNWVDATVVPADLTASTYAMTTSSTAVSAASASLAKESATVSATVSAAYSAKVTLACTNVLDGYVFEGWYDANGNKITSYTVSNAHTVYARFIQSAEETNEVSVTYMCDATEVSPAIAEIVGVETEKSFTAPTVTGYKFTNWTIGAGITLKAGTASDATITVVTKSSSSDYTLIANYEEVIETIYFINTGKWNVVNLHRWNGTATATAWPGEAMPKTGEKIGEYDVHSFTAQQGAFKNVIFTNKNTGNDQTGDLEWTAGKYYINNYNGNSGWYTKAEAEELLVAPIVYEKVYFVNNKNWTKVQIHAWKGTANNGWPGQALTATGEKVEGFDVYSFEAAQGSYTNLLFNNKVGDTGEQSSNYVWTADKYYYMGATDDYAGGTKEEVAALVAPDPLATDVFLAGEMNDWNATANEFKKAAAEATTASVTISLTAETYMFKIVAGDWLGNKGTMKRDNCAGWTFEKLDGGEETNCKIVADIAGDYTFTWDLTTKKLTVTYPELPTPTYDVTTTATVSTQGQNIVLSGSWEEKALTVMLWQGGATQGFGTYAAEDYAPIFLGAAELTPTSEGVYADNSDGTFTFTATATDSEGAIYNITLTGDNPVVEPEYKEWEGSVLFTEEEGTLSIIYAASDWSWFLELYIENYTGHSTYEVANVYYGDETVEYYDMYGTVTVEYADWAGTDVLYADLTSGDGTLKVWATLYNEEPVAAEYDVVITNATVTENTSGYYIDMTGEWDGHTIKVEVCDELTADNILANFFIDGGIINGGNQAEGTVEATVSGGIVTITGTFECMGTGDVYHVTISGTLPDNLTTAVDNLNATVAPVKMINNGQLVIIKNGVQYNAQGAVVK